MNYGEMKKRLLSPITTSWTKVRKKAGLMKPEIRGVALEWGAVTRGITEVIAIIRVFNPNPISIPVKKVACDIVMNDIKLGSAETVDLHIEKKAEFPVKISVGIDSSKIPDVWVEHLKRGEKSEVQIDIAATFDLIVSDFALHFHRVQPINTNLLAELQKVLSSRDNHQLKSS